MQHRIGRRQFLFGATTGGVLPVVTKTATPQPQVPKPDDFSPLVSVPNLSKLESLRPFDGATVFVVGRDEPADGGEGNFFWNAAGVGEEDGGTIVPSHHSPNGRWQRIWSGPISLKWFDSIANALAFIEAHTPTSVYVPKGIWDLKGFQIPLNSHWYGDGWGQDGVGGSVILGRPVQKTGKQGANSFRMLTFRGGLVIRKQRALIEHCLFTGKAREPGLLFDQTGASPYFSKVDACWFDECAPYGIAFRGQANAITVVGSTIKVPEGSRNFALKLERNTVGNVPHTISVFGTAMEASHKAAAIGGFVYCAGRRCFFAGNYIDNNNPEYRQGAAWFFDKGSANNFAIHTNSNRPNRDSVIDNGKTNTNSWPGS